MLSRWSMSKPVNPRCTTGGASNGAAKRLLEQGGVSVNKRKLAGSDRHVPASDVLLRGGHVVVGKGKRDYALLRVLG